MTTAVRLRVQTETICRTRHSDLHRRLDVIARSRLMMVVMDGSEVLVGALGIGREFDLRYVPMSDMCKTFSPIAYARLLACARKSLLF